MARVDDWRPRNDSVADHLASIHARTKQVVPASISKRTSYSLYPACSPSSPVSPINSPALADLPPRPQSASQETVIHSGPPEDHPTIDATGEFFVEDFFSQLAPANRASGQPDNILPGLGNGVHRRLPKTTGLLANSGPAALAPEVSRIRSHSASPLTPSLKRMSRAETDGRSSSIPTTPDQSLGSSTGALSEVSSASSEPTLAPLQAHGVQNELDLMETICEDDPANYDLLTAPPPASQKPYSLEARAVQLFSREHLRQIFADPRLLAHFASFLDTHRPKSVRLLMFYFDALKASRALSYSNAVSQALAPMNGYDFSSTLPSRANNPGLDDRGHKAFDALASDDLAAFIAHTWTNTVSQSVQKRVTGTLAPHLKEASEGLAEVFCLSDPARPDNPIVFASAQFQKTTQYGMSHCVGRNCRFLQGPHTDPRAVHRISEAVKAGKEHTEVFVNYRRDGQPFMNLLMIAPLHDARGTIRYFIGAQVDVSGLTKDATGLKGLRRLLRREEDPEYARKQDEAAERDEFRALAEMFNKQELDAVQQHGGHMHNPQFDDNDDDDDRARSGRASAASDRPRLLLTDTAASPDGKAKDPALIQREIASSGRLQGVYQHYLLIRPAPSLRILFTSPSLRIPGILQTPFLSRIGGSAHIRGELANAFADGRSVTAKVRWLPRPGADDDEGRSRWIHATPLLNHKGEVGVWMVVLVDGDSAPGDGRRRFKAPPPVVPASPEPLQRARQQREGVRDDEMGNRASTGRKADRNTPLDRDGQQQPPLDQRRLTVGGTPIVARPKSAAAASSLSKKVVIAGEEYDMAATYMPRRSDSDPRRRSSVSFFDDSDAAAASALPKRSASSQSRRGAGV